MDRDGVPRRCGSASPPRRRHATAPTATTSSARPPTIVGAAPELLSGEEEGRLSFLGATTDLDPGLGPFLVVDIGGGSTEFSLEDGSMSIDVGCVRLTEAYLEHDPPKPEELHACIAVTSEYLKDVVRELPGVTEAKTFVGLAGTVTTVAAVEIGLRHLRPRPRSTTSCSPTRRPRTCSAPWPPSRAPTASTTRASRRRGPTSSSAAAACWWRSSASSASSECLVSEADILDGLVLSMLDNDV